MIAVQLVMQALLSGAERSAEVHEMTGVRIGTVQSTLRALRLDGYVRVTRVSENRAQHYELTDRGRAVAEAGLLEPVEDGDDNEAHRICVAPPGFVERAMRLRTPLELAWCGELNDLLGAQSLAGQTNGARVVSV